MKKKSMKLTLSRETLSALDSERLGKVVGEGGYTFVTCQTCPIIYGSGCGC
jgi:hypothetical protein